MIKYYHSYETKLFYYHSYETKRTETVWIASYKSDFAGVVLISVVSGSTSFFPSLLYDFKTSGVGVWGVSDGRGEVRGEVNCACYQCSCFLP
jgi:hypothetical protein